MSLLENYNVDYNKKKEYIMTFNTTVKASATYSVETDGTNVITLNEDTKGKTRFKNTFTSINGEFKYVFNQPDGTAKRRQIPGGTTFP